VLDAAARLAGAHGYHAVTTARLAAEAGIAEGTIYHHFRSKDEILCEAAARFGRGFADAMFGGTDAQSSLPDVDAVIGRAFAYVRFTDPAFGAFLLADDPGRSTAAKRANRTEIVSRLARLIARWKDQGWIRDANPQVLAELCFGLVEAGLRECYARGRIEDSIERIYVSEVAHCVRGMLEPRA
jgi:AcrR family transcriptional regulator